MNKISGMYYTSVGNGGTELDIDVPVIRTGNASPYTNNGMAGLRQTVAYGKRRDRRICLARMISIKVLGTRENIQ